MKTRHILIFVLTITGLLSCSQSGQMAGFQQYKLADIGHILIPENMEKQAGEHRERVEAHLREQGFEPNNRIVFQKKGVNDGGSKVFVSNYVRVAINTTRGDYGRIRRRSDFTAADLREVGNSILKVLQNSGAEILEWNGTTLVSINNQFALKTSFIREPVANIRWYSQTPVAVSMYLFFNGDRSHTLSVEYRVSEAERWEATLEKVVNSFTITNVR